MTSTVHVPTNDAVLVFTDTLPIKGVGVKNWSFDTIGWYDRKFWMCTTMYLNCLKIMDNVPIRREKLHVAKYSRAVNAGL